MIRLKRTSHEKIYEDIPKQKPPRYDLRKLKVRKDKDTKELNVEDDDLKINGHQNSK